MKLSLVAEALESETKCESTGLIHLPQTRETIKKAFEQKRISRREQKYLKQLVEDRQQELENKKSVPEKTKPKQKQPSLF